MRAEEAMRTPVRFPAPPPIHAAVARGYAAPKSRDSTARQIDGGCVAPGNESQQPLGQPARWPALVTLTYGETMARHMTIPVADTVLDANDTEGDGFPLLLLNGMLATQRSWKGLLQLLEGRYRVVTFDARARGRSGTSKDYSFASSLEDVSAVLEATGTSRPVLVGWSHGAAIAVRIAALHPDAVSAIVSIAGAYQLEKI